MKTMISKIIARLAGGSIHAKGSDIKGNKSGGIRDADKVDWRTEGRSS